MSANRSVIATFRPMSVHGELYSVPLYVHRRLGDRDGWCVTVAGLRRFFADGDSTVADALAEASAFLAAALRYELDVVRPYLPITVHVVDTVNSVNMGRDRDTHTVLGSFTNQFGNDQLVHVGTLKPLIDRHFECKYLWPNLPSWLSHLSYDAVCEAWLANFKTATSHLFYPDEFHNFIHQTLQPVSPQQSLVF